MLKVDTISQVTDSSFLYFNKELLAPLLAEIWAHGEEGHKLPYVLAGFLDGHRLLKDATADAPALRQVVS